MSTKYKQRLTIERIDTYQSCHTLHFRKDISKMGSPISKIAKNSEITDCTYIFLPDTVLTAKRVR
jgi:hypothetical protein